MELDPALVFLIVFVAMVAFGSALSIYQSIRDDEIASNSRLSALPDDFKSYLRGLSHNNPKPWTNKDIDLALAEYARDAGRRQALATQQTALAVGSDD